VSFVRETRVGNAIPFSLAITAHFFPRFNLQQEQKMMRLAPAAKFLAFARTSSSFRLTNDAQRLVCLRMMSAAAAAAAPGPKVCVCVSFCPCF
jgi:hypothetical protein